MNRDVVRFCRVLHSSARHFEISIVGIQERTRPRASSSGVGNQWVSNCNYILRTFWKLNAG